MKVTEITVKHFFKYEFDHVCCLAGVHPMDLVPSNLANLHPCKTGDKNGILGEAVNYVYCIALSLNACSDTPRKPYRTILTGCFFKLQQDKQTKKEIGCSNNQYYKYKKQAKREFSDWFMHYQYKMNFDEIVKLVDS